MSSPAEISMCTHQDYNQILDELHEFWGARETRHLHHPTSFTSLETRRSSFATEGKPNQLDMCIWLLCGPPPVGKASRVSFSDTSWSSLGGMAAGT